MATINLLFPCKKLRRSLRLECKDSKPDLIDTSNYAGPLGYIDMLPLELKFLIFTYLPGYFVINTNLIAFNLCKLL